MYFTQNKILELEIAYEPHARYDLATVCLQYKCSTNWANGAESNSIWINHFQIELDIFDLKISNG